MGLPVAPLIQAGASIGSTIFNASQQGRMNRKQMKFTEYMYGKQRKDALTDWEMQNAYNSPEQQMARMKKAGLNPNLVYGSGAEATSGQQPRSASSGSWDPKAPQIDLGTPVMGYADATIKQAQTDNLREQLKLLEQETLNKAIQSWATIQGVQKTQADTALTKFNLEQGQKLSDLVVKKAEMDIESVGAHTKVTLDQNERAAAMQASTLQKALEEILTLRKSRAKTDADINHINQQIENLKKDQQLKQLDIRLKELGIQPGDNILLRQIPIILDKLNKTKPGDLLPDYKGKSLFNLDLDKIFGRDK